MTHIFRISSLFGSLRDLILFLFLFFMNLAKVCGQFSTEYIFRSLQYSHSLVGACLGLCTHLFELRFD